MRQIESKIQSACVEKFRQYYPKLTLLLWAIPNGGKRDAKTGYWMKQDGVLKGVPDVVLKVPKGKYASLCIEFKSKVGRQSKEQKEVQKALEEHGNKYVICRSVSEFIIEIENYLHS